ncbi:MAG TPA: extracellular solute-binding protein [Kofleriaceae bacterium]|nr:extracellular solute-binding protein [Kofleriaceae bacterium]
MKRLVFPSLGLAFGLAFVTACGQDRAAPTPIRFLHTFGAEETEVFNATMAERGIAVESSLVPFARGQQVISEILRAGNACPDLIRIDATWLPGFVAAKLLAPVPANLAQGDWLPEAVALATPPGDNQVAALPETVDGLFVLRDDAAPPPASASIADLVAATQAVQHPGRPHPLGLRVDGYWLVPWLRAEGADLAVGKIDDDGAVRAITSFAGLFGTLVPPPPSAGDEAPDELRRWGGHEIAYWVTGPWQVGALRDREHLAASPLARAPRGGQLLVVPACAQNPAAGWRLAGELTSVEVERKFAEKFASVPTRQAALAAAPPLVRQIHDALSATEMLPRSPLTPLLFDDLNPALDAVVGGDATPEEVVEGVRRGWRRLESRAYP